MIGMDASTGRAISGIDHLVQSMTDILTTPIGTRMTAPPSWVKARSAEVDAGRA